KPTSVWPAAADALRETEICAVSGLPVSEWCPERRTGLIPKSQFVLRRCGLHQPAMPSTSSTAASNQDFPNSKFSALEALSGSRTSSMSYSELRPAANRLPVIEVWPASARHWDLARPRSEAPDLVDITDRPKSLAPKDSAIVDSPRNEMLKALRILA